MDIKIGENLKRLRSKYNYTLENVAEFIGVSRQSVSKWEKGETYPDIENCLMLSKLYKVTIDALVKNYIEPMEENSDNQQFVCEALTVGVNGQINLPQKSRKLFGINEGDTLILLCDSKKGMALVKSSAMGGE